MLPVVNKFSRRHICAIALATLTMLATLITSASFPQAAQAAETENYEVTITDCSVEANALDFFAYSNLLPGDIREGRATISNKSGTPQVVTFTGDLTSNNSVTAELMQSSELSICYGDETIFSGTIEASKTPDGGIKLGVLYPNEYKLMSWKLYVAKTASREIANGYAEVAWSWSSREATPEELGVIPSESTSTINKNTSSNSEESSFINDENIVDESGDALLEESATDNTKTDSGELIQAGDALLALAILTIVTVSAFTVAVLTRPRHKVNFVIPKCRRHQ